MNKLSFFTNGNIEIITGIGMHEFPYHTHNSFMIGTILEGCGEFCIDGNISILYKGDCYIVPSDIGISIKPICDFSYITICIKKELAKNMREYRCDKFYYHGLSNHLNELAARFRNNQIDEQYFTVYITNIFGLYREGNTVKSDITLKAIQYINFHCERKFSLDELAKNCFTSKYHLIRIFKNEMSITPKQYHQQCKVRKLKNMIFTLSQNDITYMLSFSTQSHMNSIFKKYMGITLGNYMSIMRMNEQ